MKKAPKISVSIMMHPTRKKYIKYFQEQLGEGVAIAMDRKNDIRDTCRRAWLMFDPKADYHVVLQDDAIVCKEFLQKAKKFVAKFGTSNAFQFYFGNRTALKDIATEGLKEGYAINNTLRWGVAICLPTRLIKSMVRYCDGLDVKQDDIRIRAFIKQKHMQVIYPLPSLVDHREGPSLVGDPGQHRKCFYFIDTYVKT